MITPLSLSQLDTAADTLTAAFDADPIYTLVMSDAAERRRYLPPFWRAVTRSALLSGHSYAAADTAGVALWMPPGRPSPSWMDHLRTGFALQRSVVAFPAEARRRFLAFLNYADPIHEDVMSKRWHWYLWVLGVRPDRQGQGLGGQLMAPILSQADRDGLPCYLETESERNVAFYRKHGFEVVHEGDIPGYGLRLWMMTREATPSR
jgi:ribosomal protein S18 acetylase RimI-like enzyme